MIPPEVKAALDIVAGRPKFGDPPTIHAMGILARWKEIPCTTCDGQGYCYKCGGTRKVWVRR